MTELETPSIVEGIFRRAVDYEAAGDFDEAREQYQRCISLGGFSSSAFSGLANTYLNQRRFSDAVGLYELAIVLDPENGIAHNNLGTALVFSDRLIDAKSHFLEAIQYGCIDGHVNMGYALEKEGKLRPAWTHFRAYTISGENNDLVLEAEREIERLSVRLTEQLAKERRLRAI